MSENKIQPPLAVDLTWKGGLRFQAVNDLGLSLTLDGDSKEGFSPMTSLLSALCGCMAIDVVHILSRMKVLPEAFSLKASGHRQEKEPRYFHRIHLEFHLRGPDLALNKVERAVQLSFDKYCSVFHTLRPDIEVTRSIDLASN